jgi:hypothetical protein
VGEFDGKGRAEKKKVTWKENEERRGEGTRDGYEKGKEKVK